MWHRVMYGRVKCIILPLWNIVKLKIIRQWQWQWHRHRHHHPRTRTQYNMMVMDANLPSKEVYAILKSFRNIHNHDNDNNNNNSNEEWGLLIYGKLIHLYQIAVRGIASADVYSPLMDPEDCGVDIQRGYFGDWDQVDYCTSVFFGLNQNCNQNHNQESEL